MDACYRSLYFAAFVAAAWSVLSPVVHGQECPTDWVSFQDSCYVFVNDVATWTGGQTVCRLLNAHLVEIETVAENDFVVSQMQNNSVSKTWTGLNDFVREGRFVWTTSNEPAEFTNWSPGEPNDDATNQRLGDQDCGAIYSTGKWDDEYCESTHRQQFFCERKSMEDVIG